MLRVKKKYIGLVNGNVVYKWAYDVDEFKRLCRSEFMGKHGRCDITDHKVIDVKKKQVTDYADK